MSLFYQFSLSLDTVSNNIFLDHKINRGRNCDIKLEINFFGEKKTTLITASLYYILILKSVDHLFIISIGYNQNEDIGVY